MKTFRLIAIDETAYCTLPEGVTQIYGIYLFCEGEATYCCSIKPSTWLEPVDVALIYPDFPPDGGWEEDYEQLRQDHAECGHYVPYIDPENLPILVSRPIEVEDDLDIDDEAARRNDAWEEAKDQARSNPPTVGGIYP